MSLPHSTARVGRYVFAAALTGALGAGFLVSHVVRRGPTPQEVARQRAATPAGMVFVPAGAFAMGSNDPDADEDARPQRQVTIRSFYIGRTEVTNAEFHRFRPSFDYPLGHGGYPVTGVTFEEAAGYCRWARGRLPTETEWEKAARGTDGRRYPWGNTWHPSRGNFQKPSAARHAACWINRRGLAPVGTFPTGASPYGALDMAGNAWEWVDGFYQGHPDQRVIRGGACGYGELSQRTYARGIEGNGAT